MHRETYVIVRELQRQGYMQSIYRSTYSIVRSIRDRQGWCNTKGMYRSKSNKVNLNLSQNWHWKTTNKIDELNFFVVSLTVFYAQKRKKDTQGQVAKVTFKPNERPVMLSTICVCHWVWG